MKFEEFTRDYDNQVISEEYNLWMKNATTLYGTVIVQELQAATYSLQWLPDKNNTLESDYTIHKCLIGTSSPQKFKNYVIVLKVKIPVDMGCWALSRGEEDSESKVEVDTKILNEGEINRCRYNPLKNNVVAAKSSTSEISIYDYSEHPNRPTSSISRPELKLSGHHAEGYGLSWNEHKAGLLLSGSSDGLILIWNIEEVLQTKQSMRPHFEFAYSQKYGAVHDVSWSKHHPDVFASCGEAGLLAIWDMRSKGGPHRKPDLEKIAHSAGVLALDFNPFNQNLLLTASEDKEITLWDTRNFTKRLHVFEGHNEAVVNVKWNPNLPNIFCSGSFDRRCVVWDVSKILSSKNGEEMVFIHGGHRTKVHDFSWNENEPWLISSVEENNILNVWEPAEAFHS